MTHVETTFGALFPEAGEGAESPVSGLAYDSRKVEEGFAFVAVPGTKANGAAFIADALARGAKAIVGEVRRPPTLFPEIPYLQVADARRALSLAAARLHPGQPETVVAVTGTSGKSSVAEFVRQLFQATGRESASLGTLGITTRGGAHYGSLTTPDPITLHQDLERLAGDGVTHLAMEASSHGIDQRRLDGVRLAAAAFTNLGRDHLDYHPTVEDYLQAKLRLFRDLLPEGRPVVVNLDGAEGARVARFAAEHRHPVMTVGREGEAVRLLSVDRVGFAQRLMLRAGGRDISVDLPLVGGFQVENALVAAGLVLAAEPGLDPVAVLRRMSGLTGVAGRLDRIGEVEGALCVVDYAHKPEALAAVLDTLRPFATGRLVCVFGCGGDRDRGKRPIMGAIAAEKADVVVVTDDNPRSEDPASIRAAILAAAPGAREIGDRREAIGHAVAELGPGDVLVVAGKGHETGQIVGDTVLPFSDHDEIRAAMQARSRESRS
ncbi:UDP-N-acetylmuramoyl-L-alanyl-D-glutamate--2,6-diaminopimelate ligase [Enterovirga rhinocerotis]|nr:UDP-N-acetylmuramoyl-L-alanyl-D-glutamate--2,6-diaminopimelate ligase [Enterovirga rhinocerotis]